MNYQGSICLIRIRGVLIGFARVLEGSLGIMGPLLVNDNLALEASERPETGLELLTRACSIRFFPHLLISSRITQGTQLIMNPSDNDYWVRIFFE